MHRLLLLGHTICTHIRTHWPEVLDFYCPLAWFNVFIIQWILAKCYSTFYIQREVIFCDILWNSLLWVIIYALGVIPTQIQAKWCENMGTKLKVWSFSYNSSQKSVRLSLFYIQREVIFCDNLWYSLLWVIIYALGIIPTQIQAKWCQNMGTKLKVRSFSYNGSR